VVFGDDVIVWGYANLYGCRIGAGSRIGTFVEIQRDVVIGERVRIQSHTFVCSHVVIEDDVFVGHNVTFINDRFPACATAPAGTWVPEATRICRGASIGSGAVLMCGVTVGEEALIGAASLVLADVPPRALVVGVPGRVVRIMAPGELLARAEGRAFAG